MHTEGRAHPDAHPGMPCACLAGEPRHVPQRVPAGREEVRHHHDLARSLGDARVDCRGQARRREREMCRRDALPAQAPPERGRDGRELGVRGTFAAAVIDEDHGPHTVVATGFASDLAEPDGTNGHQ